MTFQRLSPVIRLSRTINTKCAIPTQAVCFSTAYLRQLQHPSPSSSPQFLPRILDPAVWFPSYKKKPKEGKTGVKERHPKSHNSATFFVIMTMLIGSQGIQMIRVRHAHDDYMRRAETKIAVLREVVERLERGEDVDVEKMLGTGDEKQEKSWEEVLKELEDEDAEWTAKRNQKAQHAPSMAGNDKAAAEAFGPQEKKLEGPDQEAPSKPRGPRSARDYRFS